eukprot:TRINITY_DN11319_c0_g1_i1.p1 TRINITY_DN11319_c0_g1~~TRINITY_DN11319_c0_g1_i1.p1  ORF type:complete len:263 (-),score=23.88 TRINITY_DN11319_c0_g1_i1:1121-1909(-)
MAEKTDFLSVRLNGKNYFSWDFQFRMFVHEKNLWGHIDGSNEKPTDVEKLAKWEIDDVKIISWILNSVELHFVLNLCSYPTAKEIWNYLKRVYNQEISARRFQLGCDLSEYSQGNKTIEEYYAGFINLWTEFNSLAYSTVSITEILALREFHKESQRDQFLMKLYGEFESVRSELMNKDPLPSLDMCLNELLREEQRLVTQNIMAQKGNILDNAYASQAKPRNCDLSKTQCYSSKEYGHLANQCKKKLCNYCKRTGHIISEC